MNNLITRLNSLITASMAAVKRKYDDQRGRDLFTRSTRNHKANTVHEHRDGRAYVVAPSGAWLRIDKSTPLLHAMTFDKLQDHGVDEGLIDTVMG